MINYLPRDIRQIKLVNGEELLTEVVGEDSAELLIRNPLKVHRERMQINDIAREANMFTRWMGFSDNDEHILKKEFVIIQDIVNDAVALYYNKMTANILEDQVNPISSADEASDPDLVKSTINYVEPDDTDEGPTYH
jgi:chorismate mutase